MNEADIVHAVIDRQFFAIHGRKGQGMGFMAPLKGTEVLSNDSSRNSVVERQAAERSE